MRLSWLIAIFAASSAAQPAANLRPPGEMVDVGGRAMHIHCLGSGAPAVILTSGMGESGQNWAPVHAELAKTSRVCAWDRAGLGFSDASPEPQDAAHTTADLERLLKAARVAGPYVLVGHSIGSFETLMFAYRHPGSVAAMVLVDPSSPFQNRAFAAASPAFGAFNATRLKDRAAQMRGCAAALRAGDLLAKACGNPAPTASPAARIAIAEAIASMTENWDASSGQLVKARRALGGIPLIVLTAGRRAPLPGELEREQPKIAAAWSKMHDDLAAASSRGVRQDVPDAAHYIHVDRPDAVVSAIEEAIAAARGRVRAD